MQEVTPDPQPAETTIDVAVLMIGARTARLEVSVDGSPRLTLTSASARQLADDLQHEARRADALESAFGALYDAGKAANE